MLHTRNAHTVYVGTNSRKGDAGIHRLCFEPHFNAILESKLVAQTPTPSFLFLHPRLPVLYAVNEVSEYQGIASGAVSAFRIDYDKGDQLVPINTQISHGRSPAYLWVDPLGDNVLVANYNGPSTAIFGLGPDGALQACSHHFPYEGKGALPGRQASAHPHAIHLDASGTLCFVPDLGSDRLWVHRCTLHQGKLRLDPPMEFATAPGSGPRHVAFHPHEPWGYLLCELNSTVIAFSFNASSGMVIFQEPIDTVPAQSGTESYAAEVSVHPNGNFLYCSNRGHDSIAVFDIHPTTGSLKSRAYIPSGGNTPRHFALTRDGRNLLVANQNSNNVVVFDVNRESGLPTPNGIQADIHAPSCICPVPGLRGRRAQRALSV